MSKQFINDLRSADSEKLIEPIYHRELKAHIIAEGGHILDLKSFSKTDGVIDGQFYFDGSVHVFRVIVETKYQETFSDVRTRAKALVQVVYYLKQFEDRGDEIPNIILVGDRDECFVLHTNHVLHLLNYQVDWKIAPSKAWVGNSDMLKEICESVDIQKNCFVYVIDDNFLFSDVMAKIKSLVLDVKMEVRLTERNISKIFEYFTMRILKKKTSGESLYTPREQVEFFMSLILETDDCFVHPRKKGLAKIANHDVKVDTTAFESFTHHYTFKYNANEKKEFTSICDRLIEDADRRRKGDFYTPAIWVDESHKMLADNLGVNWKDEYMVWDCAWGTGNLTRDYKFFDLYTSTLESHDLTIAKKYNEEAVKFQYDFLNDDVQFFDDLLVKVRMGYILSERDFRGSKLWQFAPSIVRGMLAGKKLLFFINPPYGTAGEMSSAVTGKEKKSDISMTEINKLMLRDNIGGSSQQLYAQFLYRINSFIDLMQTDIKVGIFSPSLFMTSEYFKGLRDNSLNGRYLDGFMFQASEFADVKPNWAISFTLWGVNGSNNHTVALKHMVDGKVVNFANKELYYVPKELKASNWVKSKLDKMVNPYDIFTMSSGINVTGGNTKTSKEVLAWALMDSNIVEKNTSFVTLLPTRLKGNLSAFAITEGSIEPVLSYFSARKIITGNNATWVNGKDDYMIPNVNHAEYQQWENDCLVYALFNTSFGASSLRGIDFSGDSHDIHNHFFFMSKEEMEKLSLGASPNDDIYNDIQRHGSSNRVFYDKLNSINLSSDAREVLESARYLIHQSFQYRDEFNDARPEYHINTWDAGWYQLKGLLDEYMKSDLKEFNELYKKLEERMRPLVYELGFLKN